MVFVKFNFFGFFGVEMDFKMFVWWYIVNLKEYFELFYVMFLIVGWC